MADITANTGTAVAKPADPTKAGHAVAGWFNAASGGEQYAWPHTLTGNVTMHAQWQENAQPPAQYTITFNTHGGTAAVAITADSGTAVPKPGDPARSGYTFVGWFSAETGGTQYAWPHTLTGSVTMHAQWTVNSFDQSITLTMDDFTDPAAGGVTEAPFTLAKPGGSKTVSVSGSDDDTAARWYVGLGQIGTGSSVTLNAATLSLGKHTLRVTAEYGGVRYSKELAFTVTE
jgi:uncharacterized repeat protein (TIGR02543 family)